MTRWVSRLFGQLIRFFQSPQPTVDRSRLVGMYLSQANRPPDVGSRGAPNRERQDGKFAQNRRRG